MRSSLVVRLVVASTVLLLPIMAHAQDTSVTSFISGVADPRLHSDHRGGRT